MKTLAAGLLAGLALFAAGDDDAENSQPRPQETKDMQLGAFSISLAVKDLAASHEFYSKLGFERTGGDPEQNWLVLRNGERVVGLFQGMFEKNILTFNPGWDQLAQPLHEFEDVRDLHARVKRAGLETMQEAGLDGDGVGSFVLVDPDGNPVLIDQHVPKPKQ